ncbi:MAG: sigma-70 family RNA polymerase sigma factor [Pirellulaceae bacterium]|jgi:RNA polymerase sigma-70 factor (ECF subfamily)|nr:sigma-70 family RNA polymerase sigma factor [Pirellulaceae bacterium]
MSPGTKHPDPAGQLQLARHGAAEARGALLENYRSYLELLARVEIGRRLQTKLDTADVVQETFLEAHRHFDQFRGATEAELISWLRGIFSAKLANLVRHYLGTQGRDLRREQALEINLDHSSRLLDRGLFAAGGTPSQQVVRREQGLLLAEALAQLPDDYREVIVLRHLEELTFPEVAARLERTVDSVQKLWVRALAKLRQSMGEPT